MGFAIGQPLLWPALPDWSSPVNETLAWLTDLMQAPTGGQQARQLRTAPRRSFAFQTLDDRDGRRIADSLRFDLGVQQFLLPIWPDVQKLASAVAAGTTTLTCDTSGYDFVAGGRAVLWQSPTAWELVTIAASGVADGALTLAAATASAWPIGTRLYPVRAARLAQPPQETQASDEIGSLQVSIAIDEPCDWPAAWPSATTYRGLAVLDWRGDESNDPTDEYDRVSTTLDADTGPIWYYDTAGMPFRAQKQDFLLTGRADHTKFRALAYQLAGRAGTCWVPDWQNSVQLTTAVAASATQISVPWMGYTQFGYQQAGRRDLRIELFDATVLYRRITGSADAGDHEVLQLDSAPAVAIDPSQVRQINFMAVSALASDSVQLVHDGDASGVATASLSWQAVKSDV